MSNVEIDEAFIRLVKMVWYFHMILARQLPNPEDEAAFQAKLYRKIDPETTKDIIVATHCPNCAMHKISTQANSLCTYF